MKIFPYILSILFAFILFASISLAELPDFAKPLPLEPELRPPPEGMVFIAGGCFDMGDTFEDGSLDEKPVHNVCVDDFYIGQHEVTIGEFRAFVKETGYKTEAEQGDGCFGWNGKEFKREKQFNWSNPGFSQTDKNPFVCISWNDANEYVSWKGKKTGKAFRLPTEAEWEYAARSGGKNYKYSWGNGSPSGNIADEALKRQFSNAHIWAGYDDGYVYTAPVGSFKSNELGLYDMTGNVWEWAQDWYDEGYYKNTLKTTLMGHQAVNTASFAAVPGAMCRGSCAWRTWSGTVRMDGSRTPGSVWRCPPPSNNFLGSRILFSGLSAMDIEK